VSLKVSEGFSEIIIPNGQLKERSDTSTVASELGQTNRHPGIKTPGYF